MLEESEWPYRQCQEETQTKMRGKKTTDPFREKTNVASPVPA